VAGNAPAAQAGLAAAWRGGKETVVFGDEDPALSQRRDDPGAPAETAAVSAGDRMRARSGQRSFTRMLGEAIESYLERRDGDDARCGAFARDPLVRHLSSRDGCGGGH
jgi:hypothetical protein